VPNKDGLDDIRIIIGREVSEQRAVRNAQRSTTTWDPQTTTGTTTTFPAWTTTDTTAGTAFQAYVRPGYLLE